MREVWPPILSSPVASSARYSTKTRSFRTTAAGLNVAVASHATPGRGRMTGLASSAFVNGPSIHDSWAVSGPGVKELSSKRESVVYCNVRRSPSVGLVIGLMAGCAHPRSGSPQQVADTTRRDSTFGGAPRREVVTGDEIRKDQPIEEALSGRFPGVEVNRTSDGGIAVRIRGGSSLMGSNEPLYVIDGVEI